MQRIGTVFNGFMLETGHAIGVTALVANNTVPSVSVRTEIITEEEKDILKIEIPISRTVVSTRSGKMLKRRLKADGTPEVIPMFSYEIVTRFSAHF